MSSFFSKANLHSAIWALVVGLIGFCAALVWKSYSGPDEVKIINSNTAKKDTTYTIVQFQPLEMRDNNKVYNNTNVSKSKNIKRHADDKQIFQSSAAIVDSLIKATISRDKDLKISTEIRAIPPTTPVEDNISINSTNIIAPFNRPKFTLPTIVTGYTSGELNSYTNISISKEYYTKSDEAEIFISIFNADVLNKITPLFISVLKQTSPNNYNLMWSEQYRITDTKSKIRFSCNFPKDTYEIEIGFYFREGLNTKFPTFYHKKFPFTIR